MRLVEKIAEKMWENTAKADAKRIALPEANAGNYAGDGHCLPA